jgi:FAD:protein FMN transferase
VKIKTILTYAAPLAAIAFIACSRPHIKTVEKNYMMMDSYVLFRIYDSDKSDDYKLQMIEKAAQRMQHIAELSSMYSQTSEVAALNRNAGKGFVKLSPETLDIIRESFTFSDLSGGAFDISIGSLMRLWGFGFREEMVKPADEAIQALLPFTHYSLIHIKQDSVSLADPHVQIDLGGVAGGYAVDAAIEELVKGGITDAQVDDAGDIRTIASSLTAGKRHIWVRHPVHKDGFYGKFPMDQCAVATSGDYERFFVQDSVRYCHILDPKTGYPARGCTSVTIVAPTTIQADALSTTVFVLGPEKGLQLIEKLPSIEGLIIYYENGELKHKMSPGLEKIFEIIKE